MTWPVGTAVQSELDALHAECAALRAERDEAVALLRELVAMIHGECPSLLDEDRGGDVRLALRIDALLAKRKVTP